MTNLLYTNNQYDINTYAVRVILPSLSLLGKAIKLEINDSNFILKGIFTTEFILNKAIISYFKPKNPNAKPICLVGNITGPSPELYSQAPNASFIEGSISRLVYVNSWYRDTDPFILGRDPVKSFDFFQHLLLSNIDDVINYPNQ